jgi:predicted lipoprotein with Yx(FWY)xxD motif
MRRKIVGLSALFVSLFAVQSALAQAGTDAPQQTAHPGAVALSESSPGQWTYKAFPSLRPLYINENDSDGRSSCTDSCAHAWPPLLADEPGAQVGFWTVIERDSGVLQWAYKGQPVHQRFHDSVTNPRGDGLDGFRLLKP